MTVTTNASQFNSLKPIYTFNDISKNLSNGITYWVLPNKLEENTAYLRVNLAAGSMSESFDQLGSNQILKWLFTQCATENFKEREILHYITSIGGDILVESYSGATYIQIKISNYDTQILQKVMSMLYEMVFCLKIRLLF